MKYSNDFNYYRYQPGSNITIVYDKHITHARTHERTHARTHARTHTRAHAHSCTCTLVHMHTRAHAHSCTCTLVHMHTRAHAHTHTHTHRRRRPGCRSSMGWCAPIHDEVNAPFSPFPLTMNDRSRSLAGRCFIQINSRVCDSFGCFSRIKIF